MSLKGKDINVLLKEADEKGWSIEDFFVNNGFDQEEAAELIHEGRCLLIQDKILDGLEELKK